MTAFLVVIVVILAATTFAALGYIYSNKRSSSTLAQLLEKVVNDSFQLREANNQLHSDVHEAKIQLITQEERARIDSTEMKAMAREEERSKFTSTINHHLRRLDGYLIQGVYEKDHLIDIEREVQHT